MKKYSDSTLKGFSKDFLIKIIRCLENNLEDCEERNENQFRILCKMDLERAKYAWHDLRKNPEDLPPVETEVEICCRFREKYSQKECNVYTHGIYEDGTLHTKDSKWIWDEICEYGTYCEETDDYIIPNGWWEYSHYNTDDVYNNDINDDVIAWREIEPFEEVE